MRIQKITLIAFLAGPIAVSFFLPLPAATGNASHPYSIPCCLFRETTGIPCPLCGLTRSFVSLSHGKPGRAFLYHPFGPVLYLAFLAGIASALLSRARPPATPPAETPSPWRTRGLVVFAAAWVAAWVAKLALIPPAYW